MAWLQNLAGHAENLLNKIDQNAATVLNDGNKQIADDEEQKILDAASGLLKLSRSPTPEIVLEVIREKGSDIFMPQSDAHKPASVVDETNTEKSLKSSQTSVSSSSIHNSFSATEELESLQSKIAKLELENHDVNKQLLNIQHLYSEMRNENANLQFQVERLNEQLNLAQNEKEQYVARAQSILQEKEKLISLKKAANDNDDNEINTFTKYNEELKRELEFQQTKITELSEKNLKLLNDLQSLQMQHHVIQNGLSQSNQSLEQSLLNEKKYRSIAEEDCAQKTKELQMKIQEVIHLQNFSRYATEENMKLKETLQKQPKHSETDEFENRIKSLTQTLIFKQNNLETVTTERNALRLQLEKLEVEYKKNIAELKRDRVKIINVQEINEDRISVPNFMRVSPHDAGVTRRVKHAYSTFDAISVRTGIFLRRYPLARVFVFSYMVILHIWVLTVLLWYVPSN